MDANTDGIRQHEGFHRMERREQQMWRQRTTVLLSIEPLPVDHQRTSRRDDQTVYLHGMSQLLSVDFRSNWRRILYSKEAKCPLRFQKQVQKQKQIRLVSVQIKCQLKNKTSHLLWSFLFHALDVVVFLFGWK